MSFSIISNQPALNQPTTTLTSLMANGSVQPQSSTKVSYIACANGNQINAAAAPLSPLSKLIQSITQPPLQLAQGIQSTVSNISDLSNSARAQRQEDLKQGKGLMAGARNFSSEVTGFYEFLGKIDPSKLSRDEIIPHLGGLAQNYLQKDAGNQIISITKELFPESYKEASSILGATTPTSVANSSAVAGAPALSETSATLGSIGGKLLGMAGAAYSIYQLCQGKLDPGSAALSGFAAGAYIGSSILPGVGTAIGAVLGGIGGFISGLFKSGKPKEQKERDAIRQQLLSAGILDNNWNIALANGATFDMGKDGGAILKNKDGTERSYKEFDCSNPLSQPIAQVAAPLAQAISAGNERLAQDFTAYLTNAAISNTDSVEGALQNLKVIYAKFGIPIERVLQGLTQTRQQAGAGQVLKKAA